MTDDIDALLAKEEHARLLAIAKRRPDDKADVLDALGWSAHMVSMLIERQEILIGWARERGATWEEIGEALGVSKQAVQQRWVAVLGRS